MRLAVPLFYHVKPVTETKLKLKVEVNQEKSSRIITDKYKAWICTDV
jgi:hypothetical protein